MFPGQRQFFSPIRSYQIGLPKPTFNWSSFLSNAGKTLNVVNQAIPIFYQIKPIFSNMKTMFKVAHEFKNIDNNSNASKENNTITKEERNLKNPVFFK